ncbi:MAG: LacI family transcriptional regulator [Oscillospiraceae bacterium]|nr:LacI family transcriptional regulator [Oscillospiraceae bacterium]
MSNTLVSRVLNNKPGVSPENRAKIQAIIEKHNYVPSAIARSLVTQKTSTIGVVLDNLTDPFFFGFIDGVHRMSEELNYNVVFCSGNDDYDLKAQYIDYFSQGRVDGIIAYNSNMKDVFYEQIKKASNFVIVEGNVPGKIFNKVQINNFDGAYRATTYLIKQGYKNIVHFTGDMDYHCSVDRMNGFLKAMSDYSLPTDDVIIYTDFMEELAYHKMKEVIRSRNIPEACFAGADKTAYGVLRAMIESGLTAPKDMAIIGFDGDVPDTLGINFPKLTTMRQPMFEIGREAVRLIVRAIEDPSAPPVTTVLNTEFVIGETA